MDIATALLEEIHRVVAKRTRWNEMSKTMPTLKLGIAVMDMELRDAKASLLSGDIIAIMASLQALKDYDDND